MPRARNIKPGFFKNEDLGTADPFVALLFVGLWTLADKAGILEDRPLRIRAELFPYREKFDVNRYLTVLHQLGFIHRYEVERVKYIQVVNFVKHQNPHHTEKASFLPTYSDSCQLTVNQPLSTRDAPADSLIPDSLIPDSLITDSPVPSVPEPIPGAKDKKPVSPSAQPKRVDAQGSRLPNDWKLPKAWGDWALEDNPALTAEDVRREGEKFRNHWVAKAGKDARKTDWKATWMNWIRSEYVKPSGTAPAGLSDIWFLSASGIEEKAKALGLEKAEGEVFPAFKIRVYAAAGVTDEMIRNAQADTPALRVVR